MKLSFLSCLALAFNAGFLAIILFVICEVGLAQTIKDIVDNSDYWGAFAITIIGLILSMIIATIAGIEIADDMRREDIYRASGYSLILNFLIWILICYVVVFIVAPNSAFDNLTWVDAFVAFPRILTFAAQYRFTNVPMFWIYFTVTYEFVYGYFLWYFGARTNPKRKYKQRESAKR